ncbi:signal peptidase I [Glutamicibacter soli]|uniref:Signal peptidase I n=1 Tax=Glutamicibacter soli TaxID=453836 RepID=A0A365YIB0_9MICC|nr:signal peptidase I [Glutamicibacter soli]RBM01764.1 signal peptidase I [Glutamicibacter soli]
MGNQERIKSDARNGNPLQRLALNAGAILGSLCLLMTLAAVLFGVKPLVFASGSMGPGIPTGSLGLAVPTPIVEVAIGDVVSVVTSNEVRVTHRVADKTEAGLILKGDANPVADLQPYAVDSADKLLVSFPGLGYLVTWLSQPWAYFLGGLLCAYLLYLAFSRSPQPAVGESVPRSSTQKRNSETDADACAGSPGRGDLPRAGISRLLCMVLVLSTAVASLQLRPAVESTQAAFTSTAKAGGTLHGAVMQPAKNLSCKDKSSLSGNNVINFAWQAPAAQGSKLTGYKVSVQINDSEEKFSDPLPVSTTTYSVDISPSGGLLSLLIDLLGNLFGSKFDVNFRVYAMYDNGWTAAPIVHSKAKGSIGLLGVVRSLHCS